MNVQTISALEAEKVTYPAFAEWIDKGVALAQEATCHQWAVADWMLWGEAHIPLKQVYDLAERATGYKRKTLQEWAYVARNSSIRMEALTFGHHQAVAALLPEAQKHCLEYAAANGLAIGDLREMARWQPHRLEIDPADANQDASLLLKFNNRKEFDTLQIHAQKMGFTDDEKNSAVGRLIYQLLVDFIKLHPEESLAARAEYYKASSN